MKRPKYLDKPIFEKIAILVIELYKINSAGGLLHVVLDDGNFETCHIEWSLKHIEDEVSFSVTEKEKEICKELCNLMLKLTYAQRFWIWAKVNEIKGAEKAKKIEKGEAK